MSGFLSDFGSQNRIVHNTKKSVMKHTHTHPHYELYICTDNVRQKSVINGMEYEYHYPCAILSTPYTIHSMSCEDEDAETYEHFVLYFSQGTLNEFGASLLPSRLTHRSIGLLFPLTVEQAASIKRILLLTEDPTAPMTEAERALMTGLVLNKLFDFCPEESIVQVGTSSFYLQDVLQYVAEHLRSSPNAEEIAKRFSVSRSKLDRDMKQYTGLTIHRLVELCRVNQAKYLLQYAKEYSVGEIAELCGFTEDTYFFPFFKKHTGVTPVEYRNYFDPSDTKSCDC